MDNRCIEFSPFRQMNVVAFLAMAMDIAAFWMAGWFFPRAKEASALFAVIGVSLIPVVKFFYDRSKATVIFEAEGVRILNDGKKKYCFIPWEDLQYASNYRSFKGFSYVALSKKPIDRECIKDMGDNDLSKRICVDDNTILLNLSYEDTTEVQKIIAEKVPTVTCSVDKYWLK